MEMIIELTEKELIEAFKNQILNTEVKIDGMALFSVNGMFAGKAKPSGAKSELLFEQLILPENRPAFNREDLFESNNDLGLYLVNIEEYWEIENKKEEKKIRELKKRRREFILQASTIAEDENTHTKTQYLLKQLGEACGVQVWIASNDKNKRYGDERLGGGKDLPHYPIPAEIQRRSELIDTIWFDEHKICCAFEVECSTSVYSGLLRMCDLMISMPQMPIKMYIVAPMQREEKVMKEIRRPTFEHLGLSSRVKFIPLELLEPLVERTAGLEGCLTMDVIDKIAIT